MWELPDRKPFENEFVQLVPLNADLHLDGLFAAADRRNNGGEDLFEYMKSFGPFDSKEAILGYLRSLEKNPDAFTWTVFAKSSGSIVGSLSLVNPSGQHGKVEIGRVWYNKQYHGTVVNAAALHLLLSYVFEMLKYRRAAWQCDAGNIKSRKAAENLGFAFEGKIRNDYVAKGKNRDTIWLSIIDSEWLEAKEKIERKIRKLTIASD